MATMVFIICTIVEIGCFAFIIRNFIIKFNGSDSNRKVFFTIISTILTMFCSLVSSGNSMTVNSLKETLNYASPNSNEAEIIQASIDKNTTFMLIYFALALIFLSLVVILFMSMQKKIKMQQANRGKAWDLDKIV